METSVSKGLVRNLLLYAIIKHSSFGLSRCQHIEIFNFLNLLIILYVWQIRSLDMLRARFSSLPGAFVKNLVPSRSGGHSQM
jgi:hypothetical protein